MKTKKEKLDLENAYANDQDWCIMCLACAEFPPIIFLGLVFLGGQDQ